MEVITTLVSRAPQVGLGCFMDQHKGAAGRYPIMARGYALSGGLPGPSDKLAAVFLRKLQSPPAE